MNLAVAAAVRWIWTLLLVVFGCAESHEIRFFDGDASVATRDAGVGGSRDASVGMDGQTRADAASSAHDPSCDGMDVAVRTCEATCKDAQPVVYWDGLRCREQAFLNTCTCEGEDGGRGDCDKTYRSIADCESQHLYCDPLRCSRTGGNWGLGCGHSECGLPHAIEGDSCESAHPLCVCPVGASWREGEGCVADDDCTSDLACRTTGGQTTAGDGGCACPPDHVFYGAERGCVPFAECRGCQSDLECELCAKDRACVVTGGRVYREPTRETLERLIDCGEWPNGACIDAPQGDCDTVDWYCDCGEWETFDPQYGCVPDDKCLVRRVGHFGCNQEMGGGLRTSCASDGVCENGYCQPALCGEDGSVEPGCGVLPVDRQATEPSQCEAVQIRLGCDVWTTGVRRGQQSVIRDYYDRCPPDTTRDCPPPPNDGQFFDDGSYGDVMELVVKGGRCMTRYPR